MIRMPVLLLLLALFSPASAQAAAFDLSLLNSSDLVGNTIPNEVAIQTVKAFGIYFAHRPYQGATSMYDVNAFDLNVEVTMMKIGDGVKNAMVDSGLTPTTPDTPGIPVAKVHFRKAMSPAVDIGISGIFYKGQYSIGGDVKIEVDNPEDGGVSKAIRLGYTYATAEYIYLKSVNVISPEFVLSRRLSFAEPYLGIGGRFIFGTISVPFHLPPAADFNVTKSGFSTTAYAFTGVYFRLGERGLRLAMEGSYDISGFPTIGTLFGIAF